MDIPIYSDYIYTPRDSDDTGETELYLVHKVKPPVKRGFTGCMVDFEVADEADRFRFCGILIGDSAQEESATTSNNMVTSGRRPMLQCNFTKMHHV